jgi:hypothetical protein
MKNEGNKNEFEGWLESYFQLQCETWVFVLLVKSTNGLAYRRTATSATVRFARPLTTLT